MPPAKYPPLNETWKWVSPPDIGSINGGERHIIKPPDVGDSRHEGFPSTPLEFQSRGTALINGPGRQPRRGIFAKICWAQRSRDSGPFFFVVFFFSKFAQKVRVEYVLRSSRPSLDCGGEACFAKLHLMGLFSFVPDHVRDSWIEWFSKRERRV